MADAAAASFSFESWLVVLVMLQMDIFGCGFLMMMIGSFGDRIEQRKCNLCDLNLKRGKLNDGDWFDLKLRSRGSFALLLILPFLFLYSTEMPLD